MTIAAALAWFDEPPAALTRCVESLAGVVDVLVAYDGRWEEFGDGSVHSPVEQQEAVAAAARQLGDGAAGIPRVGEWREDAWESQVAKRAAMYAHAAALADWVLVIDADEWVVRADVDELRETLAASGKLLGTIHMAGPDGRMGVRRRVFSAREGLTVDTAHNGVRTVSGKWLAGDHAYVPLEQPVDLTGVLELGHDRGASRSKERNAADHMYRMVRRANQSERWQRERSTR